MKYWVKVLLAFLFGLGLVLLLGGYGEAKSSSEFQRNPQMDRLIQAEEEQARALKEIVRILRSRR